VFSVSLFRTFASLACISAIASPAIAAQVNSHDAYIYAAVRARLANIDVDSMSAVHISVANGFVTLTGQVPSVAERQKYDAAARSVSNVTGLSDQLVVNPSYHGFKESARDNVLELRIYAAIVSQAGDNAFHVTPHVHNGVVTLTGTVPSPSVEHTIVSVTSHISGVRRVDDELTIR
jgi:osmotically-inducible protein OsmY